MKWKKIYWTRSLHRWTYTWRFDSHIQKKKILDFFATLILTVAAVVVYLVLATPIYEASVTIKVEPQTQGSLTDLFISQITSPRPDISTEVELIKSRRNIEQVVDELNLVEYFIKINLKRKMWKFLNMLL